MTTESTYHPTPTRIGLSCLHCEAGLIYDGECITTCDVCGSEIEVRRCYTCDGWGVYLRELDHWHTEEVDCPDCDGIGLFVTEPDGEEDLVARNFRVAEVWIAKAERAVTEAEAEACLAWARQYRNLMASAIQAEARRAA